MKRTEPFFDTVYYHVFNKTIEGKEIFTDNEICQYFYNLLRYYRSTVKKPSYSKYQRGMPKDKLTELKDLNKSGLFRVEIAAYCFMPNHYHLLIRQKIKSGTSRYMADCINALTRYFNTKFERKGPLFIRNFKAVGIYSEAELLQVSRYIHLNPVTDGLCTIDQLPEYKWSSYNVYAFGIPDTLVSPFEISSPQNYQAFVRQRVPYQKVLHKIKYHKYMRRCLSRASQ